MATQNTVIDIGVVTDAAPVGRAGFGTAAYADAAAMAERIRYYETATAIAADLSAGDITQAQADALNAALAQEIRPARVAAIRADPSATAQVDTVTVGGTPAEDDVATITINGTDFSYTVLSGDTTDDVATALRSAVNGGSEPVTAAGTGSDVTLTADTAGEPFTASVTATGDVTLSLANTTANAGIIPELDAVLAANAGWFGLGIASTDRDVVGQAASWAETNKRLFFAQTSSADALAGTSPNVLEDLQSNSYNWTRGHWYSDDDEPFAFALLARFLAVDPDVETTQVDCISLAGIPSDEDNISATQKLTLEGYNAGYYLPLYDVAASGGGNKLASGRFVDVQLTVAWLEARVSEALAQMLLDYASRGSKVPFTDIGFAAVEERVRDVLALGVRAGHFDDTEDASPYVNMPARANVSSADASARRLVFDFGAPLAGGVLTVQGTGTVSANLDTISALAGAGA